MSQRTVEINIVDRKLKIACPIGQETALLSAAQELSDRLIKAGASKVQTAIGTGDPATSILSFANRRKMDMIVLGTRGLGKLKGSILGSVSRKVTNNAKTSCLIVR